MQVANTLMTILSCVYFYYISKQWVWFQLFGCFLNLLAVVGTIFTPESPKFLHAQKKWDELRVVLNIIGTSNGVRTKFLGKFDRETSRFDQALMNRTELGSFTESVITSDPLKTPIM